MQINVKEKMIGLTSLITVLLFLGFIGQRVFSRLLTNREKVYFFIIIVLIIATIFFYTMLAIGKWRLKYETIFLVTVLLWGAIFNFVYPYSFGADESKHFATAYYNANILISGDEDRGLDGGRIEDIPIDYGNNGNIYDIMRPWYLVITDGNWFGEDVVGRTTVNIVPQELLLRSVRWKYVPTTIGIIIGRMFDLGHFGLLYFARYFHTIYTALMGALAIKIAPVGKSQFTTIGMLPLFIGVSASYNYDAVFFPLLLLYVALALKIHQSKSIHLADLLSIVFTYSLFTIHKVFYVPSILLFIYVMYDKYKQKKNNIGKDKTDLDKTHRKKYYMVLLAGILLVFLMVVIKFVFPIVMTIIKMDGSWSNTYTVNYMIAHPKDTLLVVYNTIVGRGWWILKQFFFGQENMAMSWFDVSEIFAITWMTLLILYSVANTDFKDNKRLRKAGWCMVFLLLAAAMLGSLIRQIGIDMTDSGKTITGRYILPILLLLLPLYHGKEKRERDVLVYYVQNIFLIILIYQTLNTIFTYRNFVLYLG